MSFDIDIEAIFENDLSKELPLMRVVVAELDGPQQDINKVFKLTNAGRMPVSGLKHLRRVRKEENGKTECILCQIDSDREDVAIDEQHVLIETRRILEQENISLKNYRISKVPARVARTGADLEAFSKVWPTKFAKSDYLVRCLEGSIVDINERLVVKLIINRLVKYLRREDCKFSSGAVIYRYTKIYGVGLSSCEIIQANPTKHSTMIAIDSVSRHAGAGHWPIETHSNGEIIRNRIQHTLDDKAELIDHKMDAGFIPYICTNYDIVMTEEPCMMCAMALIQSRIRRLFYLSQDEDNATPIPNGPHSLEPICYRDRAIERLFIHRDKNINHRFEAWRIKLVSTG